MLILDPNRTIFSCHCVQVKSNCQRHVPDIMASKWKTVLWGDELAATCCSVAGPPPPEPGALDTTHLLTSWNSLTSVMWWINLKSLGLWVKVSHEHTVTRLVLDSHELLVCNCWVSVEYSSEFTARKNVLQYYWLDPGDIDLWHLQLLMFSWLCYIGQSQSYAGSQQFSLLLYVKTPLSRLAWN